MTQTVPVSLKVHKILSHFKRPWTGLHGWSNNWRLKFNTSKCEVLTVTCKRHPFCYHYKLSNNSLKHITQVKDLKVTISSVLTWDTHIYTTLAKANRMLAFLRRNSVASFTTDQWKLLYLTFVRPYIGYASEVWAPSTINSITKIESLQCRATKFILNMHWQEDIIFLSWAPFSPQSATVNILAWSERLNFLFQVSRWPLHLTHSWLCQA